MTKFEVILVFGGGLIAGVINSMAGGGSLLTVPLLSVSGLSGLVANGTNRIAVLIQSISTVYSFYRRGIKVWQGSLPIVGPVLVGGQIGAYMVSNLDDELFKKIFGLIMIPLLILSVWKPKAKAAPKPWPIWLNGVAFFFVGIYAGAIQAGVGLILLLILARSGYSLVEANALKMFIVLCVTATVVPVFVFNGQVRWLPALVLSAGMALGGYLGAKVAVEGGDSVIKPVLVVSVLVLSGRMLGLY